jgi:transposase
MSHQGYEQSEISHSLSVVRNTVRKICSRYIDEGLESAINEKPRSGAPSVFEGKQRAKITALACTEAPDGHSQWSLRLLADRAVELCLVEDISHTQVAKILKKTK